MVLWKKATRLIYMSGKTPVQKIEIIQSIFRDVQDNFPDSYSLQNLAEKLDSREIEFRSIAYESASFCIGLKDLESGNNLNLWQNFLNEKGEHHATQIHVGLGWAFSQKQINPVPFLTQLQPMMRYRVPDGYGYYEGVFRKRKSVQSQQRFETEDEVASGAYDQGLGRSIWYLSKGNIDDAKNMIEVFAMDRQKDLWRGLGIAIAYAGGCDEEMLKNIFFKTELYQTQLATGAVMALVSSSIAQYISNDTELTCKIFCNKTPEQILAFNRLILHRINIDDGNAYPRWILEIENSVC